MTFVREPDEAEVTPIYKLSTTAEKILNVIKSSGTTTNKELQQLTGYKIGTINAQISILRRRGLIESNRGGHQLSKNMEQTVQAHLIENVQFIYELALAELELSSLGVKFAVTNSLREFVIVRPTNMENLVKRLAYFKTIGGETTDYYKLTRYNRTSSVNQYLTHWIYPYKGKFHPQMIRALLNILDLKAGEVVIDPFVGSGTLPLEAQLLGINSIGVDISPLSVLQSRVKTESVYVIEKIKEIRGEAIACFSLSDISSTLLDNEDKKRYKDFLESIEDEKVRNFYMMAKLVAISDMERRRRNVIEAFKKNLDLMISSVDDHQRVVKELGLQLGKVDIRQGDARHLPLNAESVDGIITSPPYSIALDYVSNDAHAFRAMGYDPEKMRKEFVGVRGKGDEKIRLYDEDMILSINEMGRVLRSGRLCAIVIGNATYQGSVVKTIEFTIDQCERLGLRLQRNINKIIYGLYNVMQTDNTLIFKKE